MFEVVPLAPTSTHSGVVDRPRIECNPAVLYFSIFSLCDSSILGPSQGEASSMYKMCLSLSEKMIKSGRELKADSPSPMCAGNGVFFFWPGVRGRGRGRSRLLPQSQWRTVARCIAICRRRTVQ